LRLYEKIELTVEISDLESVFFGFSSRMTESTLGDGKKLDFLTFIKNFIVRP
jgi:hypothetical protein